LCKARRGVIVSANLTIGGDTERIDVAAAEIEFCECERAQSGASLAAR